MNTDRVVFIGGSGRCGTTLIAELLDLHPDIASIFEIHSFVFLLKCLRNRTVPGILLLESQYEVINEALLPATEYNWRLTREEAAYSWENYVIGPLQSGEPLVDVIRGWINLIHRVQMIRDGAQFIVHKTPVLASYLPEIREIFPNSLFIHIVRRPDAVINSYLEQDWGPSSVGEGIDWYCERVGDFMNQAPDFSNCITIKFEDLLDSPAAILERLQGFAGIPPATYEILAHNLIDTTKKRPGLSKLGPNDIRIIYEQLESRLAVIAEMYKDYAPRG
jgi:hypothetical protein